MRFSIVLLVFWCFSIYVAGRPSNSQLEQGRNSETEDTGYEGNDDSVADDYLREDQDSNIEEAQEENNENANQDAAEQDLKQDLKSSNRGRLHNEDYDAFSGNNPGNTGGDVRRDKEDLHIDYNNNFLSERNKFNIGKENDDSNNEEKSLKSFLSRNNEINKQPHKILNVNFEQESDQNEEGELLFKNTKNQVQANRNEALDVNHPRFIKHYYDPKHSRNKAFFDTMKYEGDIIERGRRQIQSDKSIEINSKSNENDELNNNRANSDTESAIISNIKKLSEHDLVDLLNSLPEDKKALLKKIMDKREITKKAGAIEENNNLENGQSDTSKIDGSFSMDSNTNTAMSINTETTENIKQTDNSEIVSTKIPESESDVTKTESKSELNIETRDDKLDTSENSNSESAVKNEANMSSKDSSKNDNKRETKLVDSKNIDDMFEFGENSEALLNQEDLSSENKEWHDVFDDESKSRGEFKRETARDDPSYYVNSVKSLEESFPHADSYGDISIDSDLPLIRVKRTEPDNIVKKRNVPIVPSLQSESDMEKDEKNEFKNYNFFDSTSDLEGDHYVKSNIHHWSQLDKKDSQLDKSPDKQKSYSENDKLSLGSDTDSVLSGVEGVDDNLMYNSGLRSKRTLQMSNMNIVGKSDQELSRNSRTIEPSNENDISINDNGINQSQYHEAEAFGPLTGNIEEVSRFKRVRRVKESPTFQEPLD